MRAGSTILDVFGNVSGTGLNASIVRATVAGAGSPDAQARAYEADVNAQLAALDPPLPPYPPERIDAHRESIRTSMESGGGAFSVGIVDYFRLTPAPILTDAELATLDLDHQDVSTADPTVLYIPPGALTGARVFNLSGAPGDWLLVRNASAHPAAITWQPEPSPDVPRPARVALTTVLPGGSLVTMQIAGAWVVLLEVRV